ncbi:hypothetical protein [Fibrella aestuarina]|uniref:hypothetical protein n=1 Tax=Fibrella aestuarina TaxID=651143 RepID=UPI0011D2060E|nr:hypothetical protein [Fibrella aestuarina]
MKHVALFLLLLTAACHDKQGLSIEPNLLIGTWNAPSSTGRPYSRWTFDKDYLYIVNDTVKTCRQAESQPYKYWIENDVLVTRYAGFTNGLFPIQDARFPVASISSTNLTLVLPDNKRKEFEKCP